MASKFGLAGGIPERRVRPIWDAVDSRQFKNALKLSTALLSKYPKSPYALALKALILERMGKNEEALSVCLNAKEILLTSDSSVYGDDLTLSTLQIVFQRLDHLDMATSCYEHACMKYPNSLELMMGLFNCYVREYSFVKQQQIAIKMYKIAGEERFLLWAVCSIQLQVCCGNGGNKLFQLAEGLLKKHIASHGLHEPEALSVYISLLEQQCKYGDALEILSGNLGSLMMIEVDKLRLQGRLLAKAGDYAAAADVFQKLLELCPGDWECFLQYIGCLLEDASIFVKEADPMNIPNSIRCTNLQISEEHFDSRMSDAVNFIQKLMVEEINKSERCLFLARLEIERQKILFGKGDADNVVEDLMQYFVRFGHLACYTSDVEMFLQALDNDKKSEFLKKLVKEYEASVSAPTKALGQSITIFKVQNIIGDMFALQVDELEDIAVRMAEMFCTNLPLSKELDAQESMHGEELLSMASTILVQLFWRTRDLGYLLESIMILEFGLTIRRYVWQYKVSLVHLYSYWNSLPLAYERYKSLDVKNILLETVSHHILPQMLSSLLWEDTNDLLREYLKFMDDHFRESADLTFLAYRHRNYSKAIEFVQFKERLQRSSQYLMAKIESPVLQLKQHSDKIDEEERILESLEFGIHFVELSNEIRSKSLTFNEDLKLRPWWTPTYDKNYLLGPFEGVSYYPAENMHNQIKQTEANVMKTIEKRSLLPRMIYLSIYSASSSVKETIEANGSRVDPKHSLELKILLDRYAKILEFPFQDAVEYVFGVSSGNTNLKAPNPDIIDWMNFTVFLNAWNLNSHEATSSTWNLVNNLLSKYVLETIKSAGPTASAPGNDISFLAQLVTEPLAWHALIIQSCVRSLLPSGKKKKKGGPVEQLNSQLLHEIQLSIGSLCDILEMVTKWLKEQLSKLDTEFDPIFSSIQSKERQSGPGKVFNMVESCLTRVESVEVGDRIFEAIQSWSPAEVVRKITAGQGNLLSEFLKICESKIKFLQGLKLQL
ncbi:tetratricopeptide repeat protein [Striga asiatica]|uniref:Tetratricopeptide repeat protein n=1 Tax=Striga asiatica TaxID=4170 RepID=A0A5A7PD24_STRAF|nr:tetratricopeptide repeat protein [Striga asiatica]